MMNHTRARTPQGFFSFFLGVFWFSLPVSGSALSSFRMYHRQKKNILTLPSFLLVAQTASMCICICHLTQRGSSSSCCELHSRLLLKVCGMCICDLTQEDPPPPAPAAVGSFIQDCGCK
jgi:hypothetical protein